MAKPRITFRATFTVQHWDGEELLSSIDGLSYDAACHVAQANSSITGTARMMAELEDWQRFYVGGCPVREGTYAETTI